MTVGILKNKLITRVLLSKRDELLINEGITAIDFTKKSMKEFLYILLDAIKTEEDLLFFTELGVELTKLKLNNI